LNGQFSAFFASWREKDMVVSRAQSRNRKNLFFALLAFSARVDSERNSRLAENDGSTLSVDAFATEEKLVHKHLALSRVGFALSHFFRPGPRRSKRQAWKVLALPLLYVCLSALPSGCSVSPPKEQMPIGLPENIYITPPAQDFSGARVGIFPFESPDIHLEALYIQPPDPGYSAALALYRKLLENHVFQKIGIEPLAETHDMASLRQTARERGLDLIITGRVLYLFEGTSQLPSLLDEEIRIIEVATGQILLYAEAREAVPPFIESDLILVRIQGQNAPTTMALMDRNALKFCNLLDALRE
jgi:hypothetical protein